MTSPMATLPSLAEQNMARMAARQTVGATVDLGSSHLSMHDERGQRQLLHA
jgi:hypothetical protein